MADYLCARRTNYFHVKDPDAFRKVMETVVGEDFHNWEDRDASGNPVFAFGCYGIIDGIPHEDEEGNPDIDETSADDFLDFLKNSVTEDDAVILLEAGNEKLRYVNGTAYVITSRGYDFIDLTGAATELAGKLLGNPEYSTRTDY